jgi:hypothetical protein
MERMRSFVAERIALDSVDAEDPDAPRFDVGGEGANHALAFLLMLIAAAGREGEERCAIVSVNVDAHFSAKAV